MFYARLPHELRARLVAKRARQKREGWSLTPAKWDAAWYPGLLGGGSYQVVMNGYDHHASFSTREAAELEAARMNYLRGAYSEPAQYGLDGIA